MPHLMLLPHRKKLRKSPCTMIYVVLQSRQMKEVPVRHLSLYFRFGSYSTSFFMTKNERTWNSK